MNVTQKCIISGKYGFDLNNSNRFAIVQVEAKNGDLIKVNELGGIRYGEIWDVVEQPQHRDRPVMDLANKVVFVGGEEKKSKRTICVVGK